MMTVSLAFRVISMTSSYVPPFLLILCPRMCASLFLPVSHFSKWYSCCSFWWLS